MDGSYTMLTYGGQAGIVIARDGSSRLVTAKHNLIEKELECRTISCKGTYFRLQGSSNRTMIGFGDMNCSQPVRGLPLRNDAIWKSGIDISWGQKITVEDLGQNRYDHMSKNIGKFEMVDADFEYIAGQMVSFAIYSPWIVATWENAVRGSDFETDNVTEAELAKLFGSAGSITIYTGKISFVGEHHIEYSVNSFKGCSGAIVFLLNYDLPESVEVSDHGKAIAVHAGFSTVLGTNLGFKLNDDDVVDNN
jgi:hypothetical protein